MLYFSLKIFLTIFIKMPLKCGCKKINKNYNFFIKISNFLVKLKGKQGKTLCLTVRIARSHVGIAHMSCVSGCLQN
jgi:hypothetical protein